VGRDCPVGKVVLVTGVARHLGSRFVQTIRRQPGVDLVVGVDTQPSVHDLDGSLDVSG